MSEKETKPILIDIPMPIVTPRLILRPPMAGDGADVYAAKMESWTELNRYMPWAKVKGTAEEDEASVREAQARFVKREDMRLHGYCRETGRFIIGTGLHRFDWNIRRFEIGYWVRTSEHRKGYAAEAANALIRYAFNQLSARAVAIDVADGNTPSMGVAEKLGLVKEGVTKCDLMLPDGRVVDRHVWSCTDTKGLPPLDVKWGPP